ncbi:MAG TPA: hypothetical protein P5268_08095 [Candidatus Marinimicrobia bacterium]|nr:hypothetical protein [Candidatus Neomarinimicrobiota bacterium]HRS52595.1 hypothetical protein [Candidatus Neomarinimicrobiota bacterium]HRU92974.1 hypothetical protein [Candidatus Neomarinimicrobiota bacterium]
MTTKRTVPVLMTFFIITFLPYLITAQEKGQLGVNVKAQLFPQVGVTYGITDKIQTRLSTYLEFSGGEFIYSTISSLSFQVKFPSDESLSTYIGPDITYHGFIDQLYLGIILGVENKVHKKLSLFAEFEPSLGVGDGIESICFFNTGVGVKYFFK